MLGIAARTLGSFAYATLLMRSVGRKSMASLNYLDLLVANTTGNLIGTFIAGQASLGTFLLAPALLISSTILTEKAAVENRQFRKIFEGSPVVVIKNGQILERNLSRHRYNVNELLLALRQKQIFDLDEVEFAILETNGRISVLKKSQHRPVKPQDLGIKTDYEGISSVIITDGVVLDQNLELNGLTLAWLEEELHRKGILDSKEVFLATLASDGTLYVDLKEQDIADGSNLTTAATEELQQ